MNVFKETKTGKVSSKRVSGLIAVFLSLGLACVDTFTDYTVNETIWITMFSGGMAMLMRKPKFKHEINNSEDENP